MKSTGVAFLNRITYIFLKRQETNCNYVRFGEDNDGGYVTCLNEIEKAKAILNFGVEGRDGFGCAVTTKHKMLNLQFDCTMNRAPACSTNDGNNKFSLACLAEKTETRNGRSFITLKDIIDQNNLYKQHIWIKLDIETGEWPGLQALPLDYLEYIDQIVMEVHFADNLPLSKLWGNLEIIENLMQHFVNVNLHSTNWACACPTQYLPTCTF